MGVPGTFIPNLHLPIVMKKLLKDDCTVVLTLDKWCVFFNRVSFEILELEQIFQRMLVQCKPTKFREINYKILVRILAIPKIISKVQSEDNLRWCVWCGDEATLEHILLQYGYTRHAKARLHGQGLLSRVL